MKSLLTLLTGLLVSCSAIAPTVEAKEKPRRTETVRARITYYSMGQQVAWSKQKRGIPFVSCAAHPRFPFGTKVSIPALRGKVGSGEFVVHDRGPAVTSRKASSGKTAVIDIYVGSKANVRKFMYSMPMYADVTFTY